MISQHPTKIYGSFILLLTSIIWGFAFVAQRQGGDAMPPMLFNGLRSFLAFFALVVLMPFLDRLCGNRPSIWGETVTAANPRRARRVLIIGGTCCGLALAVSSLFQQVGIKYTSVGKAGFITALYIVIVPLIGIFLKRKTNWVQWASAFIAIYGTYLLCATSETGYSKGDALIFACAFLFAIQILVVDYFAPKTDCVRMACLQFLVVGLISSIAGYSFGERLHLQEILNAGIAILYCGLMSSGVAYTLQMIGQKSVHPTVASLIMSMEAVFSAVGGWLILEESMSAIQLTGCAIIFFAVIISQIPLKKHGSI